ncbi:similar to GMC oxidoreductase [Paecilomyces variotii No. 5]|uniref:Similar to GMC oxidoreductase n=1 Tax=Byssochlamys spectabilis (strain No. 5 / NBRC 109023) TaxID=1356009 RepID=V5G5U8_BYSSN|nr:similar to GMC oxidoreductase [Paecilomyces variotii No. 5]
MHYHISIIAFLCPILVSVSARTFTDGLFAQSLLGSHFGVPEVSTSYDYVVIGGGTAGLAVVTRLASNSSLSVAVIETDDFPQFSNGNYPEIPAYASEFTGNDPTNINPYLDWYMYTTPQPQLDGQRRLYDSGKVIGGSSARNFLWQIRGSDGSFDKWADVVGDDSYKFHNFLKYFQRSMHFIGPKDILEALSIEVIADRPGVGQNMWDNFFVGPTYQVNVITHNSIANTAYLEEAIEEYNINRTGILTNVAFEKLASGALSDETSKALNDSFPSDWPHIQYLILDAYFGTGTDSTNGLVNAIAAFRRGRALFSTEAMKPVVIQDVYPGENYTTDEQIFEIVQESANSICNAAGTNKMGKVDDTTAVMDSHGRVIGVSGLCVVDASIFPFLPPGQPSATVYAVAEKIAEDILSGS